jgi:hypothetical protein
MSDRRLWDFDKHVWKPWSREQVAERLDELDVPWWFAGGQAIDAFLGHQSRPHEDIDIACLRWDQLALQRQLDGLDLWCAEPPGVLRPWRNGEWLDEPIHDIWCRESAETPWCLQLMLDQCEGDEWVYRRNEAVRRPFDTLVTMRDGLPYLAVEVQLLYKAKSAGIIAKNQQDFEACLPLLEYGERQWLASALQTAHAGHPWLESLRFVTAPENA